GRWLGPLPACDLARWLRSAFQSVQSRRIRFRSTVRACPRCTDSPSCRRGRCREASSRCQTSTAPACACSVTSCGLLLALDRLAIRIEHVPGVCLYPALTDHRGEQVFDRLVPILAIDEDDARANTRLGAPLVASRYSDRAGALNTG